LEFASFVPSTAKHRTATAQSRLALGWRMQDARRSALAAAAHSMR
jgi:hypothetical protein